jgi:hypothetical protein
MPDREYSPEFLINQLEGFKYALGSSPTGKKILEILNQGNPRGMHKIGGGPYMEGIRFTFPEELKTDFERLTQPPYVECLKDAVCIIDLPLELKCRDYEALKEHIAFFKRTDQGLDFQKSETPIVLRDF